MNNRNEKNMSTKNLPGEPKKIKKLLRENAEKILPRVLENLKKKKEANEC